MGKQYTVEWAISADEDLRGIIDYIARDDPAMAMTILRRLRDSASALKSLPCRGRIVPELKAFGITTYREILCLPWRLIYRIDGRRVFVLSVLDSRRNIEDILLDRLIR